jgi:hypothetical protein
MRRISWICSLVSLLRIHSAPDCEHCNARENAARTHESDLKSWDEGFGGVWRASPELAAAPGSSNCCNQRFRKPGVTTCTGPKANS